jgi:aspartate beta-hydroxylase
MKLVTKRRDLRGNRHSSGHLVGSEARAWREGEAWAFDDTIEHEAWNRSDQLRAVLIFDVWNPYITEPERALLRQFFAVAAQSGNADRKALRVRD